MTKLAISAALLVLLAGSSAYALQEPEKEKEKPQQEEKKQEPERKPEEKRPEEKRPQEKPPQQEKQQTDRAKQTDKQQEDAAKHQQQAAKQQQQQTEKQRADQNKATQEHAQQAQHQDQHNVQQAQHENAGNNHNANAGRRIPEQNFHQHFGREHSFRVARRDDRRFNYGGYWFTYNDNWPAGWSYDDDVYVDEIDGEYYLIDPVHPGLRLLIVVSD
jgi:hypothetical protein